MIGDLMITFNPVQEPWKTRSNQPWQLARDFGSAQVWTTEPDESWQGFPIATCEDDQWKLWALGEFFGTQQTWPASLDDSNSLNGHFLVLAHQKQDRQWHVLTNRLGTLHAYISRVGSSTAIGTFSPAVASVVGDRNLDWPAIGGFLKFGFFLGENTYRQNTKVISPATHLVLDQDGTVVSNTRYWQWHYEPDQTLSPDAAVEEFGEIFNEVLLEMVSNKNLALPLSGGLDSRSTLAVLGKPDLAGANSLFPFSYGYAENSVETRIARQLAEKRHLPIKTWTVQPYLFDKLDQIMAAVEGFQDITQCRQAFVIDELAQNTDHVLAAHWGDVWLDSMGFIGQTLPSRAQLSQEIIHKYQKKGGEDLLALFQVVLPVQLDESLQAEIETSLEGFSKIHEKDFMVKAWKTAQWSHRWTLASIRMYQAGLFPLLPFYDNRLVDFFLRVPSDYMIERKLQVEYIKQVAPDLARVRWQPYNANLYNYKHFNSWLLPRRAANKLVRILRNEQVIQRNWEVQFLNSKGRLGLSRWLLEDGLKLHEFVSVNRLEKMLQEFFQNPDGISGYTVSMLLTLSAWLEKYG